MYGLFTSSGAVTLQTFTNRVIWMPSSASQLLINIGTQAGRLSGQLNLVITGFVLHGGVSSQIRWST